MIIDYKRYWKAPKVKIDPTFRQNKSFLSENGIEKEKVIIIRTKMTSNNTLEKDNIVGNRHGSCYGSRIKNKSMWQYIVWSS